MDGEQARGGVNARGQSQAYPLSPMQAGMLFQALLDGEGPSAGYDIEQLHLELAEELNEGALQGAFAGLIARHSVLSSSFQWEGLEAPHQVLNDGMATAVATEDLSSLSPEAQN